MKRWLKYTAVGTGTVILIAVLLLALTQTSLFRRWLKDLIVARVNRHLNGQVNIARLDGNLFTSIRMTDVLVVYLHDTTVYLPSVRIDLQPSRLLHWELKIDSLIVESPYLKLIQATDSSWNIATLVKTDSVPAPAAAEEADTSRLRVLLDEVILRGGSISLIAQDTALPRAITQIGLRFTVQYADTAQHLELKGLSFGLDKPPFRLEQLSLSASRSANKITLGNLVIKTAHNEVGGQGTYIASDSAVSSGHLASRPFDFADVRVFLPDLNLSGNPLFEVETHLERDSLTLRIGVIEPPQRIDLNLSVANVSKALSVTTHDQVRYYLDVGLSNFSLGYWLGDTAMDYQANGTMKVAGTGFTAEDADLTAAVDLSDLRAHGRSIGQFTGSAHYLGKNLDGQFAAGGDFGELKSAFNLVDILASQTFTIDLEASHLDLAPILQNDSLHSDLSFRSRLAGSGLSKERLTASGTFVLSASTMSAIELDTAIARGSFSAKDYRLDTLWVMSDIGSLNVAGNGAIGGSSDLTFQVKLLTLSPARQMLGADVLAGGGELTGTVSGTPDSLTISGDLDLHKLQYNTFGLDSASGRFSVLAQTISVRGTARMVARRPGTPTFSFDSVAASADFDTKDVDLKVDGFYQKGITAHIESHISFDSILIVSIPTLDLIFGQQHWHGGSPNTRVTNRDDEYGVENLVLSCPLDSKSGVQSVSLAGLFSLTGNEAVTLTVDQLDLAAPASAFGTPTAIAGTLSARMELGGTASSPTLSARVVIDSGHVGQFSYRSFHADGNYDREKLTLNSFLLPLQGDSLAVTGSLPVNLSLTRTGDLVYRDRQLDLKVRTSGFPLSVVQAFSQPFKQADGYFTADMRTTNTMDSPVITGSLGLRDGRISLPRYGIEYYDILAGLSVHDAVLSLDTLQARRDQGYLTGSGTLQFDQSLLSGTIKTAQFDFLADNVYVVRHKDYQVQISGDAQLTGNGVEPRFAGNITILRSSLFLPALMEQAAAAQSGADKSMPLLVKATLAADSVADLTGPYVLRKSVEIDTAQSEWLNSLRGQFKVTIPRNTWLRSQDMNLEIGEGDIDLVKHGPDFEIFGPLKILRGQYNLYGRHFTILQGSLLFQGGTEYNPDVSMQAQYVFRTADREKRTLKLDVSGRAFSPSVKFTLDDNAIEERDAIAYIVYGRSMDELTSGQKSDAGVAQADLAKGAAANLLSNQLSQTLGSKLGLDVIDINSQGSLAAATMTVGKYLTNDLFMSYQRMIGQTQGQDAAPAVVTLEYELSRHLFLQLLQGDEKASGFDFIFKYQR